MAAGMDRPGQPAHFDDPDDCVEYLLSVVGKHIVLGIPLGTGKPNRFVNALYRRVCNDNSLQLTIFTALTPVIPGGRSLLERRFLGPVVERLYRDYERLDYADAVLRNALPSNIEVVEFYFAPGSYLSSDYAQRQHVCANYSEVTRALLDRGVNVVAQAIARRETDGEIRYSLASNPDLTLDLVREAGPARRPFLIGQVQDTMPFMPHDAEVVPGFWNAILDQDSRAGPPALFAVPNRPVGTVDYAIATHVTTMIEDGGTLQIGIGSHGDAVAHVIRLRQANNRQFRRLARSLIGTHQQALRPTLPLELEMFEQGLYAASEMLVEGLLHLIDAGVLTRKVPGNRNPEHEVILHAAFFLGAPAFYRRLLAMSEQERAAIEMTGVRFVNSLDDDFVRKSTQRRAARFVNSAMMVTLDGATVSDMLEDKRVVSGVGGQQDFVAMAQHLPDARSMIVLPSTRTKAGRVRSNIVFDYAHTTIPRQFRDIVVTEYGAVDLRSVSDRDVMVRLLSIADSRFQQSLLDKAQKAGKIETGFRIPDAFRANLPERLDAVLADGVAGDLPHFPLSSDFDDAEARAAIALDYLKQYAGSRLSLARLASQSGKPKCDLERRVLERMGLSRAEGITERINRRLLQAALVRTRSNRPLFSV